MKLLILATSFVFVAATAGASSFQVTLDTSPLTGPQTIGFALTNFDTASNLMSLSALDFGGGSLVAASEDCTLGGTFSGAGCSGDLLAGVTLEDLDPTAAFFTQQFNPASSLSFVLNTTSSFSGGVPDQFAVYLCDGTITTCYSDDATGAMLLLDLSAGTLTSSSFVTFAAALQGLSAPVVTEIPQVPDPAPVPEPGTMLLVCSGLIALARRRQAKS